MYLYNVSIITEESSHQDLISWIREKWLPKINTEVKFLKMLNSPHEGHTYCIHLVARDETEIQSFTAEHVHSLQEHITNTHKDKAFLFDSVMQYIDA